MRILNTMLATVGACVITAGASAQQDMPSKVPIAFDKYYDSKQMNEYVKAIGAAYPEIVTIKSIGTTIDRVGTVTGDQGIIAIAAVNDVGNRIGRVGIEYVITAAKHEGHAGRAAANYISKS